LILINKFQKGNIGLRLSVEFFERFFAKLNCNSPILLLAQNFDDSEMDQMTDIGFNCLFDCASKISQNQLGIQPRDPHVIFVFDLS